MKQKTVKILGEEVKVFFCMAVVCMYERANNCTFDIENIKDNYDSIKLYAAAIAALNPDTKITLDRLMYEANGSEMAELRTAMIDSINEWYPVSKAVVPDESQKSEEQEEEQPAKN